MRLETETMARKNSSHLPVDYNARIGADRPLDELDSKHHERYAERD